MQQLRHGPRRAALFAALATALLAGCATDGKDEFAGRSAEKLYAEAKADAEAGSYERAIKALERVEGLGAGTLLAQQAQLEATEVMILAARIEALGAVRRLRAPPRAGEALPSGDAPTGR